MKSQPGSKGAAEAALSFKEELVAAIHGAFEVAVEIAVREVTKLVGEAAGSDYEEMRRENDALKQRLRRAEALLDRGRAEGRSDGPLSAKQPTGAAKRADEQPQSSRAEGGDGRAPPRPEPRDQHVSPDVTCIGVVKVESNSQPYRHPAAPDHRLPPPPSAESEPTLPHVAVKQESPEEESCLESVKVEDLSLECMSEVQSKMLEEWKPKELHTQSQDPNIELSCIRLPQAHSPNMTTGLPLQTDLHSLSSELPIFQLAEPASISEAPPQVYGVHVRISRKHNSTISNHYACKSCSQTFPLPSLLRRHYGQCQQKFQQRYQPAAGSNRPRLQLYPPGCSPFRCTECNREFNRMENLKTHLRIHTGERPYTCSVCSKCFRHSGALTRHFRIHTGEKPYICGQCGKSFRNCGGLKFHERSHSKQLQ